MLAKLKISYRLFVLLGATTFAMLVTGIIGAYALNFANTSSRQLQEAVTTTNQMANLTTGLQENFVNQLANLRSGSNTWVQTDADIRKYSLQFQQQFSAVSSLSQVQSITMASEFETNAAAVNVALSEFLNMNETQSRAHLELFILNDLDAYVTPFLESAQKITNQLSNEAQLAFIKTENTLKGSQITGSVIILISLGATVTLGLLIAKSINMPINTISQTVQAVKENKQDVRTKLAGTDEINQLGQALDALLDEKQVTFEKMEEENNNINDSIIELLEGTSQLSERDLTVSLTVREDITGPVADALNMVTEETGQALAKISQVSHLVDASGSMVNEQTRKVASIAARERKLVNLSKSKLETMSSAMEQIANWCKQGDEIAETATVATNNATEAVGETVDSMNEIRDIISQAEKRIKRLSERSQEITAIIDIINNIAERTHVLALNASMQAASAGEAGKGFAVVADEVQRLAESSRNSTSQIGVLVRNIQTETSEAVETMNASISKVVDGSEKARLAGEQMQNTKNATNKLVGAVNQISQSAEKQREQTSELKDQSNNIEKSTRVSELELRRQAEHIKRLMTAAKILNDTVNLFKVPEELLEQKLVSTDKNQTAEVVSVSNNVVNQ